MLDITTDQSVTRKSDVMTSNTMVIMQRKGLRLAPLFLHRTISMQAAGYLHLGVSPSWHFHHHIEHRLVGSGIEGNVVKRRDIATISLWQGRQGSNKQYVCKISVGLISKCYKSANRPAIQRFGQELGSG